MESPLCSLRKQEKNSDGPHIVAKHCQERTNKSFVLVIFFDFG